MHHLTRSWIVIALWAIVAFAAWGPLVPGVVSSTTFLVLNGLTAVFLLLALFIRRDSTPDPSISQILYEVESGARKGR